MSKPLNFYDQDPRVARRIRQERCRFLRAKDVPLEQISEEVGLSVKYISSLTADLTDRKSRIDVPAWVPAALRNVYVQIGQLHGEHEAASKCRALKAALSNGSQIQQTDLARWEVR